MTKNYTPFYEKAATEYNNTQKELNTPEDIKVKTERYLKGMCFWYNRHDHNGDKFSPTVTDNKTNQQVPSSITCGERPYMIISGNNLNKTSETVTIAPITSGLRGSHETHVAFKLNNRGTCYVIVEHCITVNKCELGDYVYTMPGEFMPRLDKAIRNHFGIVENENTDSIKFNLAEDGTLHKLEQMISAIIKEEVEKEKKKMNQKTSETAMNLANMVKQLVCSEEEEPKKEEMKNEIKKEENTDNHKEEYKKKRIGWTPEKKREFLTDTCKMETEDIMKKWKFSSKRTIEQYRYKFRRELSESNK